MANRTTENAVNAILDTSLELEDLTPFIETANIIVSARCSDSEYSDEELTEIERWLAAHLVCVKDPQIAKEKVGEGDWTYDGKTGMGLDSTRYGQQVRMIDYKGTLAEIDKPQGDGEIKAIL